MALASSLLFMSFPSMVIGSLPTYQDIGLLAPILLFSCRLLQSFSEGGETAGAAIFLVESSPKNKVAFYSALVGVAIFAGGILGSILGYISVLPWFPEWGWRMPFWAGGFLGIIGFYVRMKAVESPMFQKIEKARKIHSSPLLEAFKHHKKGIISVIGISAGTMSAFNFTIAYIPFISKNAFFLTTGQVLLMTTCFMALGSMFLIINGILADRYGRRLWMSLGAAGVALLVPLVLFYTEVANFQALLILQVFTCFFACTLIAPLNAVSDLELFPTNVNFSGNALAWGIGGALFGGLTPLICQLLKDWTGSFWGPSLYVIFCQLLAITAIYFAPNVLQNKKADISVQDKYAELDELSDKSIDKEGYS